MTQTPLPSDFTMQRSTRDVGSLQRRLEDWLTTQLPAGAAPKVTFHAGVEANGMSSETVLLDVEWTENGEPRRGEYVARVAPTAEDIPVFPDYALADQYEAIRLVGELTDIPVPAVRWLEETGEVIGSRFFLMDRIDGIVPPDVMPYTFGDNWLFDAPDERRRHLQDATVGVLARLHAIAEPERALGFLAPSAGGHTMLARNLAATRAWYEWAAADMGRSQLVDRALTWLEANLPETNENVVTWGDARIGNTMYRDFEPVAVLDWEMATLGPRELDVSWLIFAHRVFQSIAEVMELDGMPDFLAEGDVCETYEGLTGVRLGDLTWYHLYNGVIWCIVFMRTGLRQIHFGEIEQPDDIEVLFHCRPLVEQLLAEVGA